jgi:hypothetical protein
MELKMENKKITTVGYLKRDLALYDDDMEIYFEGFDYYIDL